MSKFNTTNTNKTTNKSGFPAYKMTDKLTFATQVLTTMFGEQKFYGDNSSQIVQSALTIDPKFLAQSCIYARTVFNMRSISHVLLSILASRVDGKQYVQKVASEIIVRADDITEILACYISMFGKPIPNSLKKALAKGMNKFDAYGLGKYNGGNKSVKFKDVLQLVHPKPKNEEQDQLFYQILADELPTPYTWEVELSAKGNTKETWEELIDSGKVGYMALLRNLVNILNAQPDNIQKVYDKLANKEEVLKSKQLPFRFLSAYRTIKEKGLASSKILDVIETALEHSISNIDKIPGKTLITIDVSGSMTWAQTVNGRTVCSDIATLFAAMANQLCEDSVSWTFDTRLNEVTVPKRCGIITVADSIPVNGGGTNLILPFAKILEDKIHFDRVIVLSDNEINTNYDSDYRGNKTCQQYVDAYRQEVNPNLWVHGIDLQGYGTQQFIGGKTNILAGWSEKIFDFISAAEQGEGGLVKVIENIIVD